MPSMSKDSQIPGDTIQHQGLRAKLLKQIREKGIKDERVLEALSRVPRHLFMESSFIRFAYQDQAFPIRSGQTISQPYTVAYQTELLDIKENQRVLEVGTGSGYQTAVLLELGSRVFTIERIKTLYVESQILLKRLGYYAHFLLGDGYLGNPGYGPYDRILITAGAPEIPERLLEQLKVGGILVAPIGKPDRQVMKKCVKVSEDMYEITDHGYFVFVPLVNGKQTD